MKVQRLVEFVEILLFLLNSLKWKYEIRILINYINCALERTTDSCWTDLRIKEAINIV